MTEVTYKEQGDGKDSWIVSVWEDETKEVLMSRDIVYEDPNEVKLIDASAVDLNTLTEDQLNVLKQRLGL